MEKISYAKVDHKDLYYVSTYNHEVCAPFANKNILPDIIAIVVSAMNMVFQEYCTHILVFIAAKSPATIGGNSTAKLPSI